MVSHIACCSAPRSSETSETAAVKRAYPATTGRPGVQQTVHPLQHPQHRSSTARPAPGKSVGCVRSRSLAQTGHPLGGLLARAGPRPKAWSTRHRIGGIPRSQLDEPPGKCYAATPSRQLRKLVPLAQIQQPVIEPAGPSGWTVPSLPLACRRLTSATLPCAGGGRRDVSSLLGTVLGT